MIGFRTINQNPNEKIMELALAANDDIYIVREEIYVDLQTLQGSPEK